MKKAIFEELYNISIVIIDIIRNLSIKHKMLNEQSFIDWMDDLNRLSIDPDVKDTK